MKYAFIAVHTAAFAVSVMCQALHVLPSGYYAGRRPAPRPTRARHDGRDGGHDSQQTGTTAREMAAAEG